MNDALQQPPALRSLAELREATWITADEAVRYLSLGSLSALYRLIREHRLPYGRVGRSYRFSPAKLDAWVEAKGLTVREPWTLRQAGAR